MKKIGIISLLLIWLVSCGNNQAAEQTNQEPQQIINNTWSSDIQETTVIDANVVDSVGLQTTWVLPSTDIAQEVDSIPSFSE